MLRVRAADAKVEISFVSSLAIAQHTLLACGLILAIGTLATFVAQKIGVPDVAVFLLAGIALGPHALGVVDIKAPPH
jgi:potassium/hydrogen antiporter